MCKPIDWDEFQAEKMNAWEKGQTGFPLIDAMMRQLDATGWIHHLGRHAVSCFLTRGTTLAELEVRAGCFRQEISRLRLGPQQRKLALAFGCGSLLHALFQVVQPLPGCQIQSQRRNQNRPVHQVLGSRTQAFAIEVRIRTAPRSTLRSKGIQLHNRARLSIPPRGQETKRQRKPRQVQRQSWSHRFSGS